MTYEYKQVIILFTLLYFLFVTFLVIYHIVLNEIFLYETYEFKYEIRNNLILNCQKIIVV